MAIPAGDEARHTGGVQQPQMNRLVAEREVKSKDRQSRWWHKAHCAVVRRRGTISQNTRGLTVTGGD